MCLEETKWIGEKTEELDTTGKRKEWNKYCCGYELEGQCGRCKKNQRQDFIYKINGCMEHYQYQQCICTRNRTCSTFSKKTFGNQGIVIRIVSIGAAKEGK